MTILPQRTDLSEALRLAPSLMVRGRATRAHILVLDDLGRVQPVLDGKPLAYRDVEGQAVHVQHAADVVLLDVDDRAVAHSIAMLIAEREQETGRPTHVAAQSGTVEPDGFHRLLVAVRDPDPEWRSWVRETIERQVGPRIVRGPWTWSRPLGSDTRKANTSRGDGFLYELLAGGEVRRISLAEAQRRVRRLPGTSPRAMRARGEVAEQPQAPEPHRPAGTEVGGRVPAGTPVAQLVALLAPAAQRLLQDAAPEDRSFAQRRVEIAAARAGFSGQQLHEVLLAVPLGARWRSDHENAEGATRRLEAAAAWLREHPATARVVTPSDRIAAEEAWDAALATLCHGALDAEVVAYVAAHRAASIAQGTTTWLLADRDLAAASAISRRALRAIEARQDLVTVATRGAHTDRRVATTYTLTEGPRTDLPHIDPAVVSVRALADVCDATAGYTQGDLWAPTPGGRAALTATHAVVLALVGQSVATIPALAQALGVTARQVHRYLERLRALELVRPGRAAGRWRLGIAAATAARRTGVTGRAASRAVMDMRARALLDTRDALLAAGDVKAALLLDHEERKRTRRGKARCINPSRRVMLRELDEVAELFEDDALQIGITEGELRTGARDLMGAWAEQWIAGDHQGVAAAIEAWRAARRDRLPVPASAA